LPVRTASDHWIPSVRAPTVPQLHLGRPDLPGPIPPHPCVRVAVDERQLIPRPHPQEDQIKAGARTLWREPVPSRQHPRWRAPSARRKHQARLGGNRLAQPGFGCRQWPLAVRCEPRKPASTMRPSHVPMMPVARCRSCDPSGSPPGPPASVIPESRAFVPQRLPSPAAVGRPWTAWRRPGRTAHQEGASKGKGPSCQEAERPD
jgi:hypothetical protein